MRWVLVGLLLCGVVALTAVLTGPPALPERATVVLPRPIDASLDGLVGGPLGGGDFVVTLLDASGAPVGRVDAFWNPGQRPDETVMIIVTRRRPWWRYLLEGEWPPRGGSGQAQILGAYSGRCAAGSDRVVDAKWLDVYDAFGDH